MTTKNIQDNNIIDSMHGCISGKCGTCQKYVSCTICHSCLESNPKNIKYVVAKIIKKYDVRYFDGSTYAVNEEFEKDLTQLVKEVEDEIVTSTYLQAVDAQYEVINKIPTSSFAFQKSNPFADVAQGQNISAYADGYDAGAIEMKRRILQSLKQSKDV